MLRVCKPGAVCLVFLTGQIPDSQQAWQAKEWWLLTVGNTVKAARQTERRLCYSFECFVQATNHTRKTRTEHDEEKTAVPDWVVVRAGSC